METIERILLKITIIQFVVLLVTHFFFHELNALPELRQITQYEGVTDNNYSEVLRSIRSEQ